MNVIIQGRVVRTDEAELLAKLCQAKNLRWLDETAIAFSDASDSPELVQYCRNNKLDYAWLDEIRPLNSIGLFFSDMDSTLIDIECIDEIADMMGIKEAVAKITEASMRGELDFKASLKERVALLKGLPAEKLEHVYNERVRLSTGAEILLQTLHRTGITTVLVSGGFTFFTDRLRQHLQLTAAHANVLEIKNNTLTGKIVGEIIDAEKKRQLLIQYREKAGLQANQVIAIGDGANDIPMIQEAGLGIAYRGKPKLKAAANQALDYAPINGLLHWFG